MSKRKFRKVLGIYSLILTLLMLLFLVYIFITLENYESNQSATFLRQSLQDLTDQQLLKYLSENNQDTKLLNDYKELIDSKDLEFVKDGEDVFNAVINDRVLFTIKTKVIGEKTKLGLLTYQEREVTEITPNLERGLIYYDVIVPTNFEIYLDGKKQDIEPTGKEKYKDLSFMYYEDVMPYLGTYEINNLKGEPEITVKDSLGKDVKLTKKNYKYTTDFRYYEADTLEDAEKILGDEVDVSSIAHNWSLFLTRDLTGPSYGLNTITSYLVPDTDLYKQANAWAHSVDITFTSKHTLTNPIFT
ncbi:MAG: hypothetical protein J6X02_02710, partial [Bacilli bacterium]|nr:hypothetical protein [Bacilli bacterium]